MGVLLWCSGLRIQHCHCRSLDGSCGMGLISGPGTSTCVAKKKNNLKIKSTHWSMGCRVDVVLVIMETVWFSLSISIRVFRWPRAFLMNSSVLKGILFSWAVVLKSGLKIFNNQEFLLWLSGNKWTGIHEDWDLIPGLPQGVKDLALPRAVV